MKLSFFNNQLVSFTLIADYSLTFFDDNTQQL